MNNFEYHEVISNQILPNYLRVLIFGQLLAPIWPNLAKSLVFEILTSFSHKMNISENFEIFSNQILQDLLCVLIFGTILGPIWPNLAQFGPILAKSVVFKILTSYSYKMNIFENFEIFPNQILQDLLRVFIFGAILGPIWPNLALFVQVFSFQESDSIFKQSK